MNKRWKKVTLILDDDTQKPAWFNMDRVLLITRHEKGSILEIATKAVYLCAETPEYFGVDDTEGW